MNQFKLFFITIVTILALTSCSGNDPEPMKWECPAYDQAEISVKFTPEFYMQGQILASHGYSGEITLVCTNYPEIAIESNSYDLARLGCTATQTSKNTIKLVFKPIVFPEGGTVTAQFAVSGKNKTETTISNLQIGRKP